MMRWVEWLLGLEHIRLDQAPLSIDLSGAPSPWTMLVGAVLVMVLISLMYRYEGGSRNLRLALCAVRGAVLFLILGIVGRPNLVLRRERIDPSVVAVLFDTSASMATKDGADDGPSTPQRTRLSAAVSAMTDGQRSAIGELARRHRVELWTFSQRAARVNREADINAVRALATAMPDGAASDPVAAAEDVLAQTRGTRLAGVIMLSDGRCTRPAAPARLLDEARRRHVPLHTVAFGSPFPPRDLAITSVQADESVHKRDIVSVLVKLTATGYGLSRRATQPASAGDGRPADQPVELRDEHGTMLGSTIVHFEADPRAADADVAHAEVEFRFRATATGLLRLRVSTAALADERDTTNNAGEATVNVHEDKLRLLYVEGPPRFEYRFLCHTILREPGIISACLLLDATEAFVQEGTEPVRAFPTTAAELNKYDVVLLGDVDPMDDWLSPSQAALLVDFVGTRGGGIGFIAGERAMPRAVAGSPLERLLPVRPSATASVAADELLEDPMTFVLTAEGRRHPLLRLEVDAAANDATLAALPGWYWHAATEGPRPGAIVLARARDAQHGGDAAPLLVAGRYGAGRTLFIGSDDVWRWRRGAGEGFYDTFWLNVIRVLAGHQRATSRQWRLTADRRTYESDQQVSLRLTLRDPSATVATTEPIPVRIDVSGIGPLAEVALEPSEPGAYEGLFLPAGVSRSLSAPANAATLPSEATTAPSDGPAFATGMNQRFVATALVPGATDDQQRPTCDFTVRRSDPERTHIEADPALLDGLARGSGGQFVRPRDAASLAASIPDRGARIADDLIEPLWDTRLVLILMVLLLSVEWAARKLKGLA